MSKLASAGGEDQPAGLPSDWSGIECLALGDASRPLTLDLGCGYGVGPLSYATSRRCGDEGGLVVGCDLSPGGIGYARGLASRWEIERTAAFVRDDARSVLRRLRELHPAGAHRVLLSCPTPYAAHRARQPPSAARGPPTVSSTASSAVSGNTQLPATPDCPTFLGSQQVLDEVARTVRVGGTVHLASNVEDVAVTLLDHARKAGLEPLRVDELLDGGEPLRDEGGAVSAARSTGDASARELTRRQEQWRAGGGELAVGGGWETSTGDERARPTACWASETERTHELEGRPVHRIVLRRLA